MFFPYEIHPSCVPGDFFLFCSIFRSLRIGMVIESDAVSDLSGTQSEHRTCVMQMWNEVDRCVL